MAININGPKLAEQKKDFLEEVGILFEDFGYPRMAGRILGWLLVCDPPQQSAGDLVKAVEGSKASISMMTRLLIQGGIIERTGLPGKRSVYYKIKPGCWFDLFKMQMRFIEAMYDIAEKGLSLMKDDDAINRQRLEEIEQLYGFCAMEMPGLYVRWEERMKENNSSKD